VTSTLKAHLRRLIRHTRSACLSAFSAMIVSAVAAAAADTARIDGNVIEATSGLPLAGVTVQTEGPTPAKTRTDAKGAFSLDNLTPGRYVLVATLAGYERTESVAFDLAAGQDQSVTLAINRATEGAVKTLGRTTIRASSSLQTASVVAAAVPAQVMVKQSVFRAADALRRLPGVDVNGSETAAPGDDIVLTIRGIGALETTALIDGNPIGPGFSRGYNWELSPVFALRGVNVLYGSGSDLYGVNAIGGVIDMQTLAPTQEPEATVTQGYGTWDKLTSVLQATGTTSGGKFGYALALGTSGQDGYFHNAYFYQPAAAYDPFATNPAVRRLGIYKDDTALTNKGSLLKTQLNFSDASHLTLTWLSGNYWDDKTGNGDNDYLPYEVALATGQTQLAAARASGSDSCTKANPATFTAPPNANGSPPDDSTPSNPLCITPQQWAQATYGWQGAGPAWQSFGANGYSLRYESVVGKNTIALNTFSNIYLHTYDRTAQLPYIYVPPYPNGVPNPYWYNEKAADTGATLSDNIIVPDNELGFGYFWENSAYFYRVGGPGGAQDKPAPITHDTSFFLRDAYNPVASPLTTYLNLWFKHSTVTNTSFVDPRLAFVYKTGDNVFRVAAGKTSAQPFPSQLLSVFSPAALGSFQGNIKCSGFNAVGNLPSSDLKPEQGIDTEFGYGHRFGGDSTVQLTLYSENVFQKIYSATVPLSDLGVPFNPAPYANLVASFCGVTQAQALSLLGVSGPINLGHMMARGLDLSGRIRISQPFYIDYDYGTTSSFLVSSDPSLVNPVYGGNLTLIPGSQLPNIPLHKWDVAFDYLIGQRLDVNLATYHVSENNPKNLPAYTYGNLTLSAPVGRGIVSATITNLWQTDADYRGLIGEGYPLALNKYATASAYQPFFGAQATERFGLPYRTIEFVYSLRVR
jgi:hypothetical protein